MKKLVFTLAFMLIGLFASANTIEINNLPENETVSECCTVSVTDNSSGDTSTVKCCRTTLQEACDAAYKKAVLTHAPD